MLEHLVEGVAVVEVLAASLGPKVVQDEGSQDVKRLPKVGEAANVVGVEPGGSSSRSMEASPSRAKGQLMVMPSGASHSSQTL